MNTIKNPLNDTKLKLTISAEAAELNEIKNDVLKRLGRELKIQGFRAGKAPEKIVEKNIDQQRLQSEFIDSAINKIYSEVIRKENIRPVNKPEVNVTKFVPFTTLEFVVEVEHIGDISLPEYRGLSVKRDQAQVSAKDITIVLEQLAVREAEKKAVDRPAKLRDEVWIDFTGVDSKTKLPINGADGKDYPLILGSNTFIPGFEPELVGLKEGSVKDFDITFPSDYSVSSLQNRQVTFSVSVKQVKEVTKPEINDKFAAKVGPFKTLDQLKADIKAQLQVERDREVKTKYENDLVMAITAKTSVTIPAVLIDEQIDLMERDEKQNLIYRGQTWEEHLKSEGISEKEHRDRNRDQAENLVKMGLVLSEIAEKEHLDVTPEELQVRLQLLKGQYKDPQMQVELDKPENSRNVINQILTEKTLLKLVEYNN